MISLEFETNKRTMLYDILLFIKIFQEDTHCINEVNEYDQHNLL